MDLEFDDLEIARAQKKQGRDLEQLLSKTSPFVIGLSKKWVRPPLDPLDIAQESLLRIAKNLKKFKFESKFSTWVYTITYRTFLDEYRKIKRRESIAKVVPIDSSIENIATVSPEELSATNEDNIELIHAALEALPDHMRNAIITIDIRGLTYEQAAKELLIPIGTLRSRLARARQQLKIHLEKHGTFSATDSVLSNEVDNELSN